LISIIQITDPHLTRHNNTEIKSCNTNSSFERVLQNVVSNEQIDFIIVSGDISDDGSRESYQFYKNTLESLKKPFVSIPGNHDNKDNFKLVFQKDFPNISCIPLSDEWGLITLDSSVDDEEGGVLTDKQIKTAQDLIEASLHKNLILCLHHQPINMGFWIDEIGLQNKDQFLSLILDQPKVKAVVWGHVHHEYQTTLGSILFMSTPSTCYQFGEDETNQSRQKPGYRKIYLYDLGKLTTQVVRIN